MERAFACYGVRFGIRCDAAAVPDHLEQVLPPGAEEVPVAGVQDWFVIDVDREGVRDSYAITLNGQVVQRFPQSMAVQEMLEPALQIHVAEFAEPGLFVHAGVVSLRGKAIIIPGTSFSGKSTLVTALVRQGAGYLSDEYAVLSPDGSVAAYPRRISLREGPFGPAGRLEQSAANLNGAADTLPIGLVLFSTYVPDATWTFAALDPATGVTELCQHTVAMRRRPKDAFDVFGNIVRTAPVLKGTRGEIDEAVQRVFELASW